MGDLKLFIGNKNYSSWSLRSWLLMRQLEIPFEEELIPLDTPEFHERIAALSPNCCVPVLHHGRRTIWDTLAITEYLAELFPERNIWPKDDEARAWARSCVAEMHSGFAALRNELPMNLSRLFEEYSYSEDAAANISRIFELWESCRSRFGAAGSMLFGGFSAADAFFAPVVWRFRHYGVAVPGALDDYAKAMVALPAMQDWMAAAKKEPWTNAAYEV